MSHQCHATVIRWIDADTVVLACDIWPDIVKFEHIRLADYDAPENGKPGAKESKARALELCPVGSTVHVSLLEKHPVSFIRKVGHVYPFHHGKSVSAMLTEEHLTKADFA